jgi:hypothetical protein
MKFSTEQLITCLMAMLLLGLLGSALAASTPQVKQTAPPPKRLLLTHYMPWFVAKPFSPQWGWHWTMNHFDPNRLVNGQQEIASHYSPLIGPYDSDDPDVLHCQVMLMKLAGIDGVIVDWYGNDDFADYGVNNRNTEALLPIIQQAGMHFAICYEDQTVPKEIAAAVFSKEDAVAHGQKLMQWMQTHFFSSPAYLKRDGRPVLLSFGDPYYNDTQWDQIFSLLPQKPLYFTESSLREPTAAIGGFDWPLPHGGTQDAFQQQTLFYQRFQSSPLFIAAAFPRFDDIYQQAGVGPSYGTIEDQKGRTYVDTLTKALQSSAPFVQIVTWNDWGEGTQIEPSVQFGYRDLAATQRLRRQYLDPAFAHTAADLPLPVEWFRLRKKYADNPAAEAQLEKFFPLVIAGHLDRAKALLAKYQSK